MEAKVFHTLLYVSGTKDWPWGLAKGGALGRRGKTVIMAWRIVTGQRGEGDNTGICTVVN